MSREVPQFELDAYPVFKDTMTVVAAETINYWEEKYWTAVLTIDSVYQEKTRRSVRVFRWAWKSDNKGNIHWVRDQIYTINQAYLWERTKKAVDAMLKYL